MYKSGTIKHFLKINNHKVIAMAGAFIKNDIPYCYYKDYKYGFIGDVYVKPEYRQKGFATNLSKACLSWFKENNINTVRLLSSENAKSIFSKIGFIPTDEMVIKI